MWPERSSNPSRKSPARASTVRARCCFESYLNAFLPLQGQTPTREMPLGDPSPGAYVCIFCESRSWRGERGGAQRAHLPAGSALRTCGRAPHPDLGSEPPHLKRGFFFLELPLGNLDLGLQAHALVPVPTSKGSGRDAGRGSKLGRRISGIAAQRWHWERGCCQNCRRDSQTYQYRGRR